LGARLSQNPNENSNESIAHLLDAASWREFAGLIGVVIASLIPAALMQMSTADMHTGFLKYCAGFAITLSIALFALLRFAPAWQRSELVPPSHLLAALRSDTQFSRLLLPYF